MSEEKVKMEVSKETWDHIKDQVMEEEHKIKEKLFNELLCEAVDREVFEQEKEIAT